MGGIREVARRAGVSIATVSIALSGKRPVSAETRRQVREAAQAVGYAPNAIASSLRSGRSKLVGLIVSDIANPYFAELARAIETEAAESGYAVIVCNSNEDPKREAELLEVLRVQRVAAVLFAPAGAGGDYAKSLSVRHAAPRVAIDRHVEGLACDQVGLDNHAAARLAALHLIGLGHRRIAYVGDRPGLSTSDDRFEGFRRALADAGIPLEASLCRRGDFRGETAYAAARPLLAGPRPPTAIAAANNVLALGAMQTLGDLGLRCPSDVSVIGIDDFPWSNALHPRLTTVAQPIAEIGAAAVRFALDRLDGATGARRKPRRIALAPRLIVRDSCAPPERSETA
ncbi:MAG: LacI family transcriptional regulator [Tagaea sp.]|nr:LacI family transcriptional regulator [Tagaea sp.]